ncbi:hypothetical protein BH11MYX2_BH11MYX2_41100 [soil metagenome]
MRHRWLALVPLLSTAIAVAEPTAEQLQTRKTELEQRLGKDGLHVMIEAPFVLVGDEAPKRFASRANFVSWVLRLIEHDYFAKRPDKVIEIWLFRNETTYRAGAKKYFDDEPDTPYGYYSSSDDALIMNIGPGAGTLSHELVHPYIDANFPNAPSWFNEGLASLYEQPREKDGHMWGTTNLRLPGLTSMIKAKSLPTLAAMLGTTSEEFYAADYDAYAYARFLCQYLQDHGVLRDFYKKFSTNEKDTTGQLALEAVVGMKLDEFQPIFNKWALSLRR